MSAQDVRNQIHVGDTVYVRVQVSPTVIKYRPARVLEVMRFAVRVHEDKKERTIRFSDLELSPPDSAAPSHSSPPPPKTVEKKPTRKPLSAPLALVLPPEPPVAPPAPPAPVAAPVVAPPPAPAAPTRAPAPAVPAVSAGDSFDAFLELAAGIIDELRVEQAEILQETRALQEERDAIDAQLERLRLQNEAVNARLGKLNALRKG